ncbi:MAG: hypothetical protein COB02_08915 [Candidatus Cloacimonadota bacterium]|nr:MAG: hypothetical protein COB02_08915 [Candidatus Cloacimonadota bacterium]
MSISSFFQFSKTSLNKNKDDKLFQKVEILEQEIEVLKKMNRKLCFSVDILMSETLKKIDQEPILKRVS